MSDDSANPEEESEAVATQTPDAEASESTPDAAAGGADAEDSQEGSAIPPSNEEVSTPEFPDLKPNSVPVGASSDLNRLFDVQVTVAAELGRKSVPIQNLLGLTEGSVFELDRSVSSPIELVAQGVPLGNGEVVVVDDSFAIRIKEIYAKPT